MKYLPNLPDLQCAWILLLLCANPRFQYRARTVPPAMDEEHQRQHDNAKWTTFRDMLSLPAEMEGTSPLHVTVANAYPHANV